METEKGIKPLTNFQQNLPTWLGVIGPVLLLLGSGYQKVAKDNPERAEQWGNVPVYTQLAGLLVSLGAPGFTLSNNKVQQIAIEKAAKGAPVDSNGKKSVSLTVHHAIGQTMEEGSPDYDPELGRRLFDALHPPKIVANLETAEGIPPHSPKGGE